MTIRYNPSLREEPRDQSLAIISRKTEETILGWLERTGRLIPRELDKTKEPNTSEDWSDILDTGQYDPESNEVNSDIED